MQKFTAEKFATRGVRSKPSAYMHTSARSWRCSRLTKRNCIQRKLLQQQQQHPTLLTRSSADWGTLSSRQSRRTRPRSAGWCYSSAAPDCAAGAAVAAHRWARCAGCCRPVAGTAGSLRKRRRRAHDSPEWNIELLIMCIFFYCVCKLCYLNAQTFNAG